MKAPIQIPIPSVAQPPASPTRLMRAWLAQKSRLLAVLNDEGGLFECRFLARLLDRQAGEVTAAVGEAGTMETTILTLRTQIAADLAADDDTPGVLDRGELARLRRTLARLGHSATAHTNHLQHLV